MQQLQIYLCSAFLPQGPDRRGIEEAALRWCIDRSNFQAILAMVQVGFNPKSLITPSWEEIA